MTAAVERSHAAVERSYAAGGWLARGEALLSARDVLAARKAFAEAERLGADPDHCSGRRWLASMLGGDFESAWRETDAIRARGAADPHRFWQGEDLRGKRVIVRSLHGLGDAVQMLRFAPLLGGIAKSVVYEVPPRLVELARCFEGVREVITWGEGAPPEPPVWNAQVEMMELPYLLRLQAAQLPLATESLRLPSTEIVRAARAMGARTKPRVGLLWTCGEWNPTRGLPAGLLAPLLGSEAEFWSLATAHHTAEAAALGLREATALCGDGLLPLAATVANLDLVITVDTLAAHLAGALRKPVWLMLQYAADWRWMVGRADSPWYPSLRIFRQPAPGDWESVVGAVGTALRQWLVP